MVSPHTALYGIDVSTRIAAAKTAIVRPASNVDESEAPCVDPVAEGEHVRSALAVMPASLKERARRAPEESAPILEATVQLATDHDLAKAVDEKLRKGLGVTQAVHAAIEEHAEIFCGLGGYMAGRAADLYDVRDRAICKLRGLPAPGAPTFEEPVILVAHDLAPAETTVLNPETVKDITTEAGDPTSHTMILVAQSGIPTITKITGIPGVNEGDLLALDGGVGEVVISPIAEEVKFLEEHSRHRALALVGFSGEDAIYDGHWVKFLTNIGAVDDAKGAVEADLGGAGLLRMEFPFLGRAGAPSLEEQTGTYMKALEAFEKRRVVVRTLDVGADKPLSFVDPGGEEDPTLGRRSLRLCQVREDLVSMQFTALAVAHAKTRAKLQVMAPTVATLEEAGRSTEKARAADLPRVGIMIEIPAAAIRTNQTLSVVGFTSIGTNDPTQYTMAADRMDGKLVPLLNAWQPVILQMIKLTCEKGRTTGKPVDVCDEAGGNPLLALVLAGLGVASLSMAPSKVHAVYVGLRIHGLTTCQQIATFAVDASTPEEGRNNVLKLVAPVMQALL